MPNMAIQTYNGLKQDKYEKVFNPIQVHISFETLLPLTIGPLIKLTLKKPRLKKNMYIKSDMLKYTKKRRIHNVSACLGVVTR